METVRLKNGSEELKVLVNLTMFSLRSLLQDNPTDFYDLVMVCRNKNYGVTNQTLLNRLGLMQGNLVHTSIKNVVLSAVIGDGLNMTLTSPI